MEANLEARLKRNRSPNRLTQKPSKRNIEQSEQNLLTTLDNHRLNSREGEINHNKYLRINNTHLSAEKVAHIIKDKFLL